MKVPPHHRSRALTLATQGLRAAIDGVLSVLIAPRCAACDELLLQPTQGPVCPRCWRSVRQITPPVCEVCGDPVLPSRGRRDGGLCPRCQEGGGVIDRCRSVGEYAGALRQIVHVLKYERRRSVAAPLAALMRRCGSEVLTGADLVVPVPLHPRRRRARGFNQATEIALGLGLPVADVLRRVRSTRPQVDLPLAERQRNVQGAFAARTWPPRFPRLQEPPMLVDRCVVLVDDVTTTGATLEACAEVLKAAGACEVRALTAARVFARPR